MHRKSYLLLTIREGNRLNGSNPLGVESKKLTDALTIINDF
jgi:hypothetical protein